MFEGIDDSSDDESYEGVGGEEEEEEEEHGTAPIEVEGKEVGREEKGKEVVGEGGSEKEGRIGV